MTIDEMIKNARNVYVWVQTCEDDGIYIQVSKSHLKKGLSEYPNNVDSEKFDMFNNKDLYVN